MGHIIQGHINPPKGIIHFFSVQLYPAYTAPPLRMSAKREHEIVAEDTKNGVPSVRERKRVKWSRNVTDFEEIEQIGEGAYGQVWMGRDKQTGEIVALKKVRMDQEKEGFPITAIRELKMLRSLKHENIVQLKEIVTGANQNTVSTSLRNKHEIYMVFEYVDNDLTGLMDIPSLKFTEGQVKTYMQQLLNGLMYCHKREVLHRDIKGSNLLVDNSGNLKIADFGLARTYNDKLRRYTNRVITLWYRSPELLLGSENYGPEVDIWSVGCLLVELLLKKPLFPGKDEPEQIDYIFGTMGPPTEENWPDWETLPNAGMVPHGKYKASRLEKKLDFLSPNAYDLITKLLEFNPKIRISAEEALDHPWFWSDPMPAAKDDMPKYRASHEWQVKQRKKQARQQQQQQ